MSTLENVKFTDNPAAANANGKYLEVTVDTTRIVESWRISLFSYEWLQPDGKIKAPADLPEAEQEKRAAVEEKLQKGAALEKPILGIGLMENVEIGSGKATFLTLAAMGLTRIPVHIPKSNSDEFKDFLS